MLIRQQRGDMDTPPGSQVQPILLSLRSIFLFVLYVSLQICVVLCTVLVLCFGSHLLGLLFLLSIWCFNPRWCKHTWSLSSVVAQCFAFSVVSDSLKPDGLYAARQSPLPMEFSSKNTGVGCHFLLQRSSWSRDWTASRVSPALVGKFFTTVPPPQGVMRIALNGTCKGWATGGTHHLGALFVVLGVSHLMDAELTQSLFLCRPL